MKRPMSVVFAGILLALAMLSGKSAFALVDGITTGAGQAAQAPSFAGGVRQVWYRHNDFLHVLDNSGRLYYFKDEWRIVPRPREDTSIQSFDRIGPAPLNGIDYIIFDSEGTLWQRNAGTYERVSLPDGSERLVTFSVGSDGSKATLAVVVTRKNTGQAAYFRYLGMAGVWHPFSSLPR